MDERQRAIYALEPKTIDRLLGELADLASRAKRGEELRLPVVTMHLRSGRDLFGHVLAVGRDSSVLFHSIGRDHRSLDYDAVHLASSSIEAVTRHDVQNVGRAPDLSKDAPTKLELKRKGASLESTFGELGAKLSINFGDSELDEDQRRSLADLIEELSRIFGELLGDELGKEAIAQKIERLELRLGSSAEVSLSEKTMTFSTTSSWPSRLFGPQMKAKIEALL
jgi:hypothetical protein